MMIIIIAEARGSETMRLERVQQLTMRSSRECQAPLKLCNLYIMHLREMHYDMDNNAFAVECTKIIAIQYQNKVSCVGWVTYEVVKSVDCARPSVFNIQLHMYGAVVQRSRCPNTAPGPGAFLGPLVAPWWLKP